MPRLGVFISWSGNSRPMAEILHAWLPTALHSVRPWISREDINVGARWLEEIDRALNDCKAGIICLTPENTGSVWVAFEAGALASRVASSRLVIPVVSRMRTTDVTGPLGMFQACQMTKPDMLQLLKALNGINADDDIIPESRLTATFEGVWPELAKQLPALEEDQAAASDVEPARKSDSDLIEEILDVSKSIRILIEDQVRSSLPNPALSPEGPDQADSTGSAMSSGAGLEGREAYAELYEQILSASEIWLAGVSLQAIMRQFNDAFRECVGRERMALRVLLLDPEDELVIATATRSMYGVSSPNDLRQDIAATIEQVAALQSVGHDENAVQLRYMRNIPSTSLTMVDPLSGNGAAIAEFYPYRASSSERPHILLSEENRAERKWFLFYREQYLSMWRDARRAESS